MQWCDFVQTICLLVNVLCVAIVFVAFPQPYGFFHDCYEVRV